MNVNEPFEVCTESIIPTCDFSLYKVSFDYEHNEVTGEQIFTPYFSTSIGQFCPEFTITSELYKDSVLLQSATNKGTHGDSDNFNTIKKDFGENGEGYYRIDFEMTATDYLGNVHTETLSTEDILAMIPDCAIETTSYISFETVATNTDEVVEKYGFSIQLNEWCAWEKVTGASHFEAKWVDTAHHQGEKAFNITSEWFADSWTEQEVGLWTFEFEETFPSTDRFGSVMLSFMYEKDEYQNLVSEQYTFSEIDYVGSCTPEVTFVAITDLQLSVLTPGNLDYTVEAQIGGTGLHLCEGVAMLDYVTFYNDASYA